MSTYWVFHFEPPDGFEVIQFYSDNIDMLGNDKGFTLIELTTATVVAGVVTLALSGLMVWAVVEFEAIKRRLAAQTESLKAEILLRRYVSQAVQVEGGDLPDTGGFNLGSLAWEGGGQFSRNFTHDQLSSWSGDWQNVGAFLRETRWKTEAGLNINELKSDLWPTAIFLRKPEPPPNSTMGVMFIDGGRGDTGSMDASMTPDYGDQWVGGIVEFAMEKKTFNNAPIDGSVNVDPVVSVLFTYKIRYHYAGSKEKNWCPTADILGGVCPASETGYTDILKAVRVVLVNNRLNTRNTAPGNPPWEWDRALGPVYFFRPIFPQLTGN